MVVFFVGSSVAFYKYIFDCFENVKLLWFSADRLSPSWLISPHKSLSMRTSWERSAALTTEPVRERSAVSGYTGESFFSFDVSKQFLTQYISVSFSLYLLQGWRRYLGSQDLVQLLIVCVCVSVRVCVL